MVCVCQMKPHNLGVTSKYSPLAVERYSKETLGWAESGLTQAHLRDGYGTYIYGWLLQFLNMTRCLEWHRKCECVMEVLSGTWNSRPCFRQKGTFQSTQISLLRCVCCCWALQSVYRLPWSLGLTVLNAREQQISSVIQTQKQTVVWRLQEEPKAGLKRMSLPILSCASMLDGAFTWQVSLWWSRPCIGSQFGQGGAGGQNKADAGRSWLGSVATEQPEYKKAANWCMKLYSEEVLEMLLPELGKFIWQSLSFTFSCAGCKLECKSGLQKVDYLVEY